MGVYSCLSPCDGCKDPAGVMVGLAENIQACLRIFRRAQHQWLARDILHLPQGVFTVFVLWHTGPIRSIRLIRGRKREEFIGKDEQAINHLHFHTFCIKTAAARQKKQVNLLFALTLHTFSLKSLHNPNKCLIFAPPEPPSLLTMLKSGVVLFLYHYEIIVRQVFYAA